MTGNSTLTQDQLNAVAAAINATQVSEVPNGECFSGTCYMQDFIAGDIVITTGANVQLSGVIGTATDKDGNAWTLVGDVYVDYYNSPGDWWWGGIMLNNQWTVAGLADALQGYFIALRLMDDGEVYVEEAKQGGWWSLTRAQETNDWPWAPNPYGRPGIGGDPGPGPYNT
jgi:hypothetical protein